MFKEKKRKQWSLQGSPHLRKRKLRSTSDPLPCSSLSSPSAPYFLSYLPCFLSVCCIEVTCYVCNIWAKERTRWHLLCQGEGGILVITLFHSLILLDLALHLLLPLLSPPPLFPPFLLLPLRGRGRWVNCCMRNIPGGLVIGPFQS